MHLASGDLSLPAQWAFLAPFLIALGVVGKWLLSRLEASEIERSRLVEKIIDQVIPALDTNAEASRQILQVTKELRDELLNERELRIRAEEREKLGRQTP